MSDVLTADGRIVQVRPVRPDDGEALHRLYQEAGAESRHLRFFSAGSGLFDQEVKRLTRQPDSGHHAVIAHQGAQVIGVASYERLNDPQTAEFAILVADEWHGRGVGTLLLEQLAAHARAHGIRELVGDVLPANTGMLRVAAGISPDAAVEHDAGVAVVRIATSFDASALAHLMRESGRPRSTRFGPYWPPTASPWSAQAANSAASAGRSSTTFFSTASPVASTPSTRMPCRLMDAFAYQRFRRYRKPC